VRPEVTEGPYFVDEMLNRMDIRIDPSDGTVVDGLPLHLIFNVSDVTNGTCKPLQGAQVDIWHCNAIGQYSDVTDQGFDTKGQKWLRGYQVTDENGIAEFLTIYPGWYSGRAVHIHFKIRTTGADGNAYEFTSQLFFPDDLSDQVFTQAPYTGHSGDRDTRNEADSIYNQAGSQMILDLKEVSADVISAAAATAAAMATPEATSVAVTGSGYEATFGLGLDLSDASVGASDSASGGGGGMGPGNGGPGGPPPNGTRPSGG
jgi:protocatechuate 3,4-dioxygenase beta subunit